MIRSWRGTARVSVITLVAVAAGCDGSVPIKPEIDGGAGDRTGAPGSDQNPAVDLAPPADVIPGVDWLDRLDLPPPKEATSPEDRQTPPDVRLPPDFWVPDVAAPPDAAAPAMPHPEARALVLGRARLVGDVLSACSNQSTGSFSADRWCAFTLPHTLPGRTQLWVINATKAIAGAGVRCDPAMPAADPNCKLLTTELWTAVPQDGPAHPTTHRFDGDTLVFHARSSSTLDPYVGPIYAWRPGWPEPRQLSQGTRALTCGAHFGAELAICIEDLTDVAPLQFTLTAGPLGGLKTIARIVPTRPGTMSSQWSVAMSRSGEYLIYSTGGTLREQLESLYVVRTADIATATIVTPTKVADNISRWRLSVDGRQIFYLRGYNYSAEGDPSGNMMVADFPALTNERMLAAKVGLFQVLFDGTETNRGLGFFQDVVINRGTYKIMRDIAAPAATSTVATGVSSISISRNLDYVFFSREFDLGLSDAWVARADGTGSPCQLTASLEAAAFGTTFTLDSRLVFWADRVDRTTGVGEGWHSPVEGCGNPSARKKFAERIDFWFADRGEWLVYADNGDGVTSDLKVASLAGGTGVGAAALVQERISRLFGILPGFEALLFSITGGAGSDGLYAYRRTAFGGVRDGGGN